MNTKGVQVDAFIKSLKGSKGVFFILGLWHRFITKPIIYPYIKAHSPHFRVHGIVGSKSFHPSRFIIRPQSYVSPIPKLTKWNNTEINSPVLPKSTGYKTHKTKTLNFPKQKQNPNFVTNNSHQLISQCWLCKLHYSTWLADHVFAFGFFFLIHFLGFIDMRLWSVKLCTFRISQCRTIWSSISPPTLQTTPISLYPPRLQSSKLAWSAETPRPCRPLPRRRQPGRLPLSPPSSCLPKIWPNWGLRAIQMMM